MSKMLRRHLWDLALRAFLLIAAACLYIFDGGAPDFTVTPHPGFSWALLCAAWLALVSGMLYRLIPNRRIAIGARKHYARSFLAAPDAGDCRAAAGANRRKLHKGALISAFSWIALNTAVFAVLDTYGLLSPATAILIMLFYAVCDMVCIIFFCPFQVLFMRNRCCASCRIHNWDYIMICTPMVFYPNTYSLSLLLLSAAVLLSWEIALLRNPHFFMAETNENLRCEMCNDKLCKLHGGPDGSV